MAAAADAAYGIVRGGGASWQQQQQQLLLSGSRKSLEEEEEEEEQEEEEEGEAVRGSDSSILRSLGPSAPRACDATSAAAADGEARHVSAYAHDSRLYSNGSSRPRGSSSRNGGKNNSNNRNKHNSIRFYADELQVASPEAASGSRLHRYVSTPPQSKRRMQQQQQQQQQLPQLLYLPIKDTDTHVVLPAAPPADLSAPLSVSPVLLLGAAGTQQQGSSSRKNSSGSSTVARVVSWAREEAQEEETGRGGGGGEEEEAAKKQGGDLSVYARHLLEGKDLPEAADASNEWQLQQQQQGHTVFAVAADCRLIGEMLKREVCLLRHWLSCALHFYANHHVGSFLSILQDADYCANTVLYSNADVSNQPLAELPPAAGLAAATAGRGFAAKRAAAAAAAAEGASHADERLGRTDAAAAAEAAGTVWEGDWRVVVDAALAAHHTHAALRAWDAVTRRDELQRSEEWREKAEAAAGFAEACRAAAGASSRGVSSGATAGAAAGEHGCTTAGSSSAIAATAGASGAGLLALNISLLRRKDPSLLSLCTSAFLRLAKALLLLSGSATAPLPTWCLPSSASLLSPTAAAVAAEASRSAGGPGVAAAAGAAGAAAAAELSTAKQQQLLQQSHREVRAAEEFFRIAAMHAPLQVAPLLGLASCAVYERRWADALLLYCGLIAYCPPPPAAVTPQEQQQLLRLLGVTSAGPSVAAAAAAAQQRDGGNGPAAAGVPHWNGMLQGGGSSSSGRCVSSTCSPRFAADMRYAAGMCFYRLGRLAEARKAFARALCLYPQHAGALCGAASLLRPQEAQQQLLLLLLANRYEPSEAAVLLQLAVRSILCGELQQAEQLLRAAQPPSYCLELQAEQKYLLGWLLQQRSRPQEAAVELQRAHALRPQHRATIFRYAQCLLLLGGHARIAEAQRLLQQLLVLPHSFEALRLMGCAVMLEAELRGSTSHCKTAAGGGQAADIQKAARDLEGQRGRSLLQTLQLYERAVEYLLSAAAVDPADPVTLLLLARCYEALIASAQEPRYRRPCIVVYERIISLCVRQQQQQPSSSPEKERHQQEKTAQKGRAAEEVVVLQQQREKQEERAAAESKTFTEEVWPEGEGGEALHAIAIGAAEMPEAVPIELLNNLAVLYYAQRSFNVAHFLFSHVLDCIDDHLDSKSNSSSRSSSNSGASRSSTVRNSNEEERFSCGPGVPRKQHRGVRETAAAAARRSDAAARGIRGRGRAAAAPEDTAALVALRQLVVFNLCLVLVSLGAYSAASSYLRELCSSHSSGSLRGDAAESSNTWIVPLPEAWLMRAHLAAERGDALAAKRLCEGAMAAGSALAGGVLARTTTAASVCVSAAAETVPRGLPAVAAAAAASGGRRAHEQLSLSASNSGRRSGSRDMLTKRGRETAGGAAALGKAISLGWAADATLTLGKLLADCDKIEAAINAVMRVVGVKSAAEERDAFAFTFLATLQHRKAKRLLLQQQSSEKVYAALAESRYFFALALQASPANAYAANGVAMLLAEENLTRSLGMWGAGDYCSERADLSFVNTQRPALSIFRMLVESPFIASRDEVFYAVQTNSGLLLAALALTERPEIKLGEDLKKVDLQKLHRAFRHLLIALQVAPMKKNLYLLLARLLYDCAKFDAAVVVLQAALQRWPNDLHLAYNMVVCMDARVCSDIRMREKMEDPQLMQHLLFICQAVVQHLQRLIDAKQTWGHIDGHTLQQVRLGLLPANALHAAGGRGSYGGRGVLRNSSSSTREDDSSSSSNSNRDASVRMVPEGVEGLPSLQQLDSLLVKSRDKILPHLRKSLPLIEQNWKEQQERREARRRYQEERRRSLQEKKRQQQQQEEAEQQRQSERAEQLLEEARAIVATLPLKREEEGTAAGGAGRGGSAAAAERRAAAAAAAEEEEEEKDSGDDEQQLSLGGTGEQLARDDREGGSQSRGRKRKKEPQERKVKQQHAPGSSKEKKKRLRLHQQQQQRRLGDEEEGEEAEEEDDTAGERKYGETDGSSGGGAGWLTDAATAGTEQSIAGREEDEAAAEMVPIATSDGEGRKKKRRKEDSGTDSGRAAAEEEKEGEQQQQQDGLEEERRKAFEGAEDESAARQERRRQKKLKKKMKKLKKREKREREQHAAERELEQEADEIPVGTTEKISSPIAEVFAGEEEGAREKKEDNAAEGLPHEAELLPDGGQQGEEQAQQSLEEEQKEKEYGQQRMDDMEGEASGTERDAGDEYEKRRTFAAVQDEEQQAFAAAVRDGDASRASAEEEAGELLMEEEGQEQIEFRKEETVTARAAREGEAAPEESDLPEEEFPEDREDAVAAATESATGELGAAREAADEGSREGDLFAAEAEEEEETQERHRRHRKHKRERHEGKERERKKKKKKKKSAKRDRSSDTDEE